MKKTLILLNLIILVFAGCGKSDTEPENIKYFIFEDIKYDIKDAGIVNDVKNGIYTIVFTNGAELTGASYYGWAFDAEGAGSRLELKLFTPSNEEGALSTGRFEMIGVNLGKIAFTHAEFIHKVEFSEGGYSGFTYSQEFYDLIEGHVLFEKNDNSIDNEINYDIEFNITIKQSLESDLSASITGYYSGPLKHIEYVKQ